MRTPRVYVQGTPSEGAFVDLPADEAFHLARVLRRGAGDRLLILGSGGVALDAVVDEVTEDSPADSGGLRVRVKVLGPAAKADPETVPWTVALAVVKGESFELAVRMASELGLACIVPVWTERTVVRPEPGPRAARKSERWSRIARESAKQCGRARPIRIEEPLPLKAFLSSCSAPRKWIAVPGAPVRLRALGVEPGGGPPEAAFLIGPEGGFTPVEVDQAEAAGFEPFGFPTPVLRTPTAVALVAAMACILAVDGTL